MRRFVLAAVLGGVAAISVACLPDQGEKVKFAFANRTDSPVCYYSSPDDSSDVRCGQVEPDSTTIWVSECGYGGGADELPFTVILTLGPGGRNIYNKTLSCKTWQDSDRTFIIEERGDEFVVTEPRGFDVKP